MKFNKFYKAFLLALLISTSSFAQLLERENVQRKIVTGTRPVAGNFGYVIGPSFVELGEMADQDIDVRGFPLMGLKYYFTDNIEFRLSTQIYGKSQKIQGNLVDQLGEEDNIEKEMFYRFMPSAHYHFSSTNFLDTYVGVGLIVGTEIDEVQTTNRTNLTGDFVAESYRQQTTDLGFNLHFGIQAFVADLPLSIGAEASIRSLKRYNLQYEAATQTSVGGVVNEQNFFTRNATSTANYEALDYSEFEMGADVRILLTYYFRK
ncbi:hypothetical protein GCM10011506_19720 [Marivirga lumbricoides]|uniref:Outer membrane protein beta-barrel domain-containing protein n=1 Tax=Marivirga lumbricoides TaxID=1046115 RepID=A0A2T4DNR5_9BACT|nr:hypothetical protein C9994_11270 [Marivirga lumbricoides]GGC34311.1 hypothetical protein GCM10011506_19720 [Marivirga lumbricoides]